MSTIEHILVPSRDFPGKFALNHDMGRAISSGNGLEIFYDHFWHEGRVEYADEHGGYFFQSDDGKHIEPLKAGMIVRLPD